ncbi:MAG: alpha-L-rhamnosidase N-terminal domain-containing protein, partial [Candidatus Aminicenantes bacterium]|nr:alpha-L-rhamnosidase N-terminal domain-containing protein [Candidatus Aminicenantes bacterium]
MDWGQRYLKLRHRERFNEKRNGKGLSFWFIGLILALFLSCLKVSLLAQKITKGESDGPFKPFDLRVEYLINPLGVDIPQPRFFWKNQHPERGEKQSAYQLQVSSQADFKSIDLWDSGKVQSDSSIQIVYRGKPLESNRTYYWRVRIWDKKGQVSSWSEVAHFDTGLFRASDWKGEWIGGENLFRREFDLPAPPRRARAYICGLGYYELRINGQKVGDHVLDPG